MLKQKNLLKIILLLLAILGILVIYHLISFHFESASIDIFRMDTSDKSEFVDVYDDVAYKYEDGKIFAYGENGLKFELEIDDPIDVIYDKEIYVLYEDNHIESYDRKNGDFLNSLEVDRDIEYGHPYDEGITLYGPDSIIFVEDGLDDYWSITGLKNPVVYDDEDKGYGLIEMYLEEGKIISTYKILNGTKTIFNLSSSTESFLAAEEIDSSRILISNASIYVIENLKITDKILLEDFQDYTFDGKNLVVADGSTLKIYDDSLNLIVERDFNKEIKEVSIIDDEVIAFVEDEIMIYKDSNFTSFSTNGAKKLIENGKATYIIYPDRIEKINIE